MKSRVIHVAFVIGVTAAVVIPSGKKLLHNKRDEVNLEFIRQASMMDDYFYGDTSKKKSYNTN